MKDKKYYITHGQFESIDHYRRMFDLNAETVSGLCDSEKDDIVYGFILGKMHSHLKDCYFNMMKLTDEIIEQRIDKTNKNK